VTDEPVRKPPGFSAFKALLEKLVKVPKAEIDEKEAEYLEQKDERPRVGARKKPA
jgi:hypothetical protein